MTSRKKYRTPLILVAVTVVFFYCGCQSEEGQRMCSCSEYESMSEQVKELTVWVLQDQFRPRDAESIWPAPADIPEHLLRYVHENYEDCPCVRAVVAVYYLRYNLALEENGMFSHAGGGESDLLHFLNPLPESPSTELLRKEIEKEKLEYYHLDEYMGGIGLALLESVQREADERIAELRDESNTQAGIP